MQLKKDKFKALLQQDGFVFRHVKNRITKRIQINDHKTAVIKIHDAMGLKEYIGSLLKGKLAITSAYHEKKAIETLQNLHIKVAQIIDYDEFGFLCYKKSYLIIEDLGDCKSLEDIVLDYKKEKKINYKTKKHYIKTVATIARILHQNGLVHRDFYLCHFIIKQDDLFLIDLHRVINANPKRIIKDLGALLFSSDNTLSNRDQLYFLSIYLDKPIRTIIQSEKDFIKKIQTRSKQLYSRTKKF